MRTDLAGPSKKLSGIRAGFIPEIQSFIVCHVLSALSLA
jgi:hypothetical protein